MGLAAATTDMSLLVQALAGTRLDAELRGPEVAVTLLAPSNAVRTQPRHVPTHNVHPPASCIGLQCSPDCDMHLMATCTRLRRAQVSYVCL